MLLRLRSHCLNFQSGFIPCILLLDHLKLALAELAVILNVFSQFLLQELSRVALLNFEFGSFCLLTPFIIFMNLDSIVATQNSPPLCSSFSLSSLDWEQNRKSYSNSKRSVSGWDLSPYSSLVPQILKDSSSSFLCFSSTWAKPSTTCQTIFSSLPLQKNKFVVWICCSKLLLFWSSAHPKRIWSQSLWGW